MLCGFAASTWLNSAPIFTPAARWRSNTDSRVAAPTSPGSSFLDESSVVVDDVMRIEPRLPRLAAEFSALLAAPAAPPPSNANSDRAAQPIARSDKIARPDLCGCAPPSTVVGSTQRQFAESRSQVVQVPSRELYQSSRPISACVQRCDRPLGTDTPFNTDLKHTRVGRRQALKASALQYVLVPPCAKASDSQWRAA
eukprot:SAG11_NODE_1386_length_5067_cov_1.750403_2_plen_197_part_00